MTQFVFGMAVGFFTGMAFLVGCIVWDLRDEMRK